MIHGFDVSNFTTVPDKATLEALCNSEHFERILIGSQFIDTFNTWYELAKQVGLDVYGWLYLYNRDSRSYAQQVLDNIRQLPTNDIKKFYLDVEDTKLPLPSEPDIIEALQVTSIPHGIYTGAWYWPMIGNPQCGQYTSLWVANYDNNPNGFDVNFGGWLRAECKQYAGNYTSYGMTIDLDSWDD